MLRIKQRAIALAQTYWLSVVQVQSGRLMHDLAKCLLTELLTVATAKGWKQAPTEQKVLPLLHELLGAEWFGSGLG